MAPFRHPRRVCVASRHHDRLAGLRSEKSAVLHPQNPGLPSKEVIHDSHRYANVNRPGSYHHQPVVARVGGAAKPVRDAAVGLG